jgi:hypothetical protein
MKYSNEQIKRAVRSAVCCQGNGLKVHLDMEDHPEAGEIFYNHFIGNIEPRLTNLLQNPRYVIKLQLITRHLHHNYK